MLLHELDGFVVQHRSVLDGRDAGLEHWLKAIRKFQQYEVEIVVPGHGERIDPGLLEHTLELLAGVGSPM